MSISSEESKINLESSQSWDQADLAELVGADDLSEKFNDEDLADYLEQDLEDHSNLSEVSPSDLRSVLIQSQVEHSP
jgi:hypothetical protein